MSPIQDSSRRFYQVAIGTATVGALVFIGTQAVNEEGENTAGSGGTTTSATTGTTTTTTTSASPYSCVGMTANTPGGPDPWGGCWPGEGNTGPAVTPTTAYTPLPAGPPGPSVGNRYVFTGPTTIDGFVFNDDILVTGGPVVIKNSIITGNVEVYETGDLTVEDSISDAGSWPGAAFGGYNIDVVRSEVTGGAQATICNGGCHWADNYLHDQHTFSEADGAHQSAWASTGVFDGYTMSLTHSVAWCTVIPSLPTGASGCTADIALLGDFAPIQYTTLHRNLIPYSSGSSVCLYAGYGSAAHNPFADDAHHVVVTENVFGKDPTTGKCGVYGTTTNWSDAPPGNVWSGNVFTDGSTVVPNV